MSNIDLQVKGKLEITENLSLYKSVVLKPNMVGERNILTQGMVNLPNTKYIVKWEYDLDGATITLEEGCIMEFDGGSFSNGTVVGNETIIIYTEDLETEFNVTTSGTFIYKSFESDRPSTDGMGYVILRKDKTFAEQIANKTNTIFEIRYDFSFGNVITGDLSIGADSVTIGNETYYYKSVQVGAGKAIHLLNNDLYFIGFSPNTIDLFNRVRTFDSATTVFIASKSSNKTYENAYKIQNYVEIPANCVLSFNGGKLLNGTLILDYDTKIDCPKNYQIFDLTLDVMTKFIGEHPNDNHRNREYNALWFGLSPLNDDNAPYLQKLFSISYGTFFIPSGTYNIKSVVVGINALWNSYYIGDTRGKSGTVFKFYLENFDIGGEGYKVLTGITAGAINLKFHNISFTTDNGNTPIGSGVSTYFNCIELLDTAAPGQIDSDIDNCNFSIFGACVEAHGRGLRFTNNSISNCGDIVRYYPALKQQYGGGEYNMQDPPFDGRAIYISGNRLHTINNLNANVDILGYLLHLKSVSGQPANTNVVGVFISNNLSDVTGSLIYADVKINGGLISNNVFSMQDKLLCYFVKGVKNMVINGNDFTHKGYWGSATPQYAIRINLDRITNEQTQQEYWDSNNNIISNNHFPEDVTDAGIYITNTYSVVGKFNNYIINGNIFNPTNDIPFVLLNLVTGSNCSMLGNVYPAQKIVDGVEVDRTNDFVKFTNGFFRSSLVETYGRIPPGGETYSNIKNTFFYRGKTSGVSPDRPNYQVDYAIGAPFFDKDVKKPAWWNLEKWIEADGASYHVRRYGPTSQRPSFSKVYDGFRYFDTTLEMDIIAHNNTWVDSNGRTPGKHSGDIADLPNFISGTAGANDDGYQFTFTDDATYGDKTVWWNTNAGNGGAWVDANGTVVITNP